MRFSTIVSVLSTVALAVAVPAVEKRTVVKGFDVSDWQPSVDWSAAYKSGLRFAYIKATEGDNIIDSTVSKSYSLVR